ncbi:M48 family metallopeptidase [Rheinheimera maricola]|uniref:M48 family metallopeptidase n=1 Tax=Rheinheimera maricola TaxID=2793282 RepID=A0ABS7XFX7_9GAMM|nr:SprT family zinc-dependent metalloprotease [Rheinheimera maricola]MBZ9613558.1 M48 family metallopeptidase [Rheinheimera maricola]
MPAVVVKAEHFNYCVYFSAKRRSIALQVKQGQLSVRAPLGCSLLDVEALVVSKQSWVLKHLQHNKSQIAPDWLMLQQLPYLGDTLMVSILSGKRQWVEMSGNQIYLWVSNKCKADDMTKKAAELARKWYQQQAHIWFVERVSYWQQLMNLYPGVMVVGNWKTKWGYCKSDAEVGFNWRLLMGPAWVADYVVIHELAHLKHLNHSREFWRLVEQYCPQRRLAIEWLKQNQYWMTI